MFSKEQKNTDGRTKFPYSKFGSSAERPAPYSRNYLSASLVLLTLFFFFCALTSSQPVLYTHTKDPPGKLTDSISAREPTNQRKVHGGGGIPLQLSSSEVWSFLPFEIRARCATRLLLRPFCPEKNPKGGGVFFFKDDVSCIFRNCGKKGLFLRWFF